MAQIHVLSSPQAGRYEVALHFLTPSGTNAADVPWQTVLLAVQPPEALQAASDGEQAAHDAGDLVEITERIDMPAGLSQAQMLAGLDRKAAAAISEWKTEFARRYAYWGFSRGEVN